jgi:hypothetical protein
MIGGHKMALFPLGKLYSTHGVAELQQQDPGFVEHVWRSLERYKKGDWGDMTKDDKARNNAAVAAGEDGGRIFAAYEHPEQPKVWIITESDRSCTTILFPEEY